MPNQSNIAACRQTKSGTATKADTGSTLHALFLGAPTVDWTSNKILVYGCCPFFVIVSSTNYRFTVCFFNTAGLLIYTRGTRRLTEYTDDCFPHIVFFKQTTLFHLPLHHYRDTRQTISTIEIQWSMPKIALYNRQTKCKQRTMPLRRHTLRTLQKNLNHPRLKPPAPGVNPKLFGLLLPVCHRGSIARTWD